MQTFSFDAAFIGILISVFGLTFLVTKYDDRGNPGTLSEIVARKSNSLFIFRLIVLIVALLFAWTIFFFVAPRINHTYIGYLKIVYSLTFISEVLLGVFAAKGKLENLIHIAFAYGMAAGGLITAIIFVLNFEHLRVYYLLEITIMVLVLCMGVMTYLDKKRFIYYELPFIWLSHASIIIASLGLR